MAEVTADFLKGLALWGLYATLLLAGYWCAWAVAVRRSKRRWPTLHEVIDSLLD